MKRNLIGTLSLVVLSLLLNATGAYAQAIAKSDVPFAFMVGSRQLPAGRYVVSTDGFASITIRSADTGASVMSLVRAESPSNQTPKLVFHHLGNQYLLAEVWGVEGRAGMIVPTSNLEKELEMASGSSKTAEKVVIALK
jgi:hypothetical protein